MLLNQCLDPLLFDLFIKVYFIDRKLIATSERHFEDNLYLMQNCLSRQRKTDYIFVILPSTKAFTLPYKKQREVPLLSCVQQLNRTAQDDLSYHFSIPRSI